MDQELKSEFNRIDERFNKLMDFLRENVPTREELNQEFDQLRSQVATKEELRILTSSIDAYAKIAKDYFQELTVMGARVSRMEAWIMAAAAKLGVDYKP
jgi:chromosome segregation ATPase